MLSFQEIMAKTEVQRKSIRETLQTGTYHPESASLYDGLGAAAHFEVKQTLDRMSLAEVLVKGSSVMGGDAIIAAKVHDTLVYAAKSSDICELIGYVVTQWEGADLTVDIAVDGSYVPKKATSYGAGADVNPTFTYATVTPVTYTLPIVIGGDLAEDQNFGLAQWHVEKAGEACGYKAGELALTVLKAAPDGDGTLNTAAGGADETTYAHFLQAVANNGNDQFISNAAILTPEAWRHSMGATAAGIPAAQARRPIPEGFDFTIQNVAVKYAAYPILHAASDMAGAAFTDCVTLVFDRGNSLLTGRKRWLEIKEFSNPVEDLAGAVVSFRQDSVTLYKDSICVLTEA